MDTRSPKREGKFTMHHFKKSQMLFTRSQLLIRFFCLSLILMGSSLVSISAMASNHVSAQGAPHVSQRHIVQAKSHALTLIQKRANLQETQHPT